MSEERPHRRRRPQGISPTEEETPLRIIIGQQDDQPEWMVSASQTSGAASRRGKTDAHAEQGAKTEKRILTAKKKRESAPQAAKTDAEQADSAPPAGMRTASAAEDASRQTPKQPQRQTQKQTKKPAPRKPRKLTKRERDRRNARARRTVIGALAALVAVALLVIGVRSVSRLIDIKQTLDRGDGVFYANIFVNDIPLEGMTLDEAASVVTTQVRELVDSWKITLRTQDGRSWDITGDDLNMQYDVADQLDQLWAIGHTGSSQVRYDQVKALEGQSVLRYTTLTYDLSCINQILTQIKDEIDQPAVNATRVDDDTKWPPFSYTDDVPGQVLDISGLNEQISEMVDKLESGVVDLTPTPVEASITRSYLEGQIVKLSSYDTAIANAGDYAEARQENIRIGTEKFNHLIIAANESVSFNKVTGKRTAANGYQPALEIAYGQYVEGYGGGICQVSSTLYNAVINAGLTVPTRVAHAIPSSYVAMGLDATVSDDRYDFVFKNTTGAPIYIETEFYKSKGYWHTRFTIYGRPDPNGYTYKLESEVVENIPLPDPTYKKDTTGEYVIYDDETYVYSKGREGYVVDVYLVTLDSKGLEVSREKKYTDTYKASAPVYYVGVTPRETPSPGTD